MFNDAHVSSSSFQALSQVTADNPTHVAYLLFYRSLDSLFSMDSATIEKLITKDKDLTTGLPPQIMVPVNMDNDAYVVQQKFTAQIVSRDAVQQAARALVNLPSMLMLHFLCFSHRPPTP